ncbi:substrate-binding periplasmic protein [Natronospirillum operosum]|uniref:substrate-binding periplasmic protein n=1 Tax=Natronospirillum operosum TaxID=2759953 RepID=UPI00143695AC|nr:transporter substrate-binding domain-containing protein [Natronospirillum operosum]
MIICLLLAVLLLPGWLLADTPIRIVTGNNYEPYVDEGLPAGGMLTELVSVAFELMGESPDIIFQPWSRGYQETLNGDYAATFPYVFTVERSESYLFSAPLIVVQTRIFVRSAEPAESIADLEGRRLCLPIGYVLSQEIHAVLDGLTVQLNRPESMSNCFRMLDRQRTDFVVSNLFLGQMTALEELGDLGKVRLLEEVVANTTLHLIVPRDRPEAAQLLDAFNAALSELRTEGVAAEIRQRHLGHLSVA